MAWIGVSDNISSVVAKAAQSVKTGINKHLASAKEKQTFFGNH